MHGHYSSYPRNDTDTHHLPQHEPPMPEQRHRAMRYIPRVRNHDPISNDVYDLRIHVRRHDRLSGGLLVPPEWAMQLPDAAVRPGCDGSGARARHVFSRSVLSGRLSDAYFAVQLRMFKAGNVDLLSMPCNTGTT